jgi:hypothetical protein
MNFELSNVDMEIINAKAQNRKRERVTLEMNECVFGYCPYIPLHFDRRRSDGTTAAECFFKAKHDNLFNCITENVRIPGRPKQQYHDMQKRLIGREKRHVA